MVAFVLAWIDNDLVPTVHWARVDGFIFVAFKTVGSCFERST